MAINATPPSEISVNGIDIGVCPIKATAHKPIKQA